MAKSLANELTGKILDFLLRQPRTMAWRNNTIGIPLAGGGMRNAGKRGSGDILCISNGTFWNIEVKVGKDRLRPEQISFMASVEQAGGRSIVCGTWEEFINKYNNEKENKIKI